MASVTMACARETAQPRAAMHLTCLSSRQDLIDATADEWYKDPGSKE